MAAHKPTRAEALRGAVDQTFQVAADQALVTRERAQGLVDELAHAAGRVRGALEVRAQPVDELTTLRAQVRDLRQRVSRLERARAGESPQAGRAQAAPGPGRASKTRSNQASSTPRPRAPGRSGGPRS